MGTKHHIVANSRVPLYPALKSAATKGYAVIHQHVVTHDCGCADNHTHAVIDKNASTDFCSRVNFNAGPEA